jgi:leader peptidase (prepilin peptidase) / N-methyltransferase
VDATWPYVIAFALGALIGSFLNVCIHRLPRGESLVWPSSHCPGCGARIAPFDNIPLLSYAFLRGRCRSCHQRIARRYPLVELINGLGYVLILWHFGLSPAAFVYAVLFSALVVITWIDLSHQIIPDVITLPGTVLGLVAGSTILPVGPFNSLAGMFLGAGILWVLAWVSPYVFGKEGMGGGDVKLMAMTGAFLGWKAALMTIMLGAVIGSVVGLALIMMRIMRRDEYVPFGPFLALGAIFSLFFHHELITWYLDLVHGSQ